MHGGRKFFTSYLSSRQLVIFLNVSRFEMMRQFWISKMCLFPKRIPRPIYYIWICYKNSLIQLKAAGRQLAL